MLTDFFILLTLIVTVITIVRAIFFLMQESRWNKMTDHYIFSQKNKMIEREYRELGDKLNRLEFNWNKFWNWKRWESAEHHVFIPYGHVFVWNNIVDEWYRKN